MDLSGVRLVETNLFLTQMERANLRYSRILGSTERNAALGYANLSATINYGGAMRFAKMTNALWDDKTDFRNAFMDATVLRSAEFETRMGNPCQWVGEALDDQEFFSVWHWWVKKTEVPRFLMPSDLRNVPLPTPERLAELGLTDCEPGQPFGPMPTTD
nr:hypothetical protein [Tateyamaria pelophila]